MGEIGREVKRLREERGWSKAQLAVYAGSSQPTVNQVESGKRNPSTRTLQKLAGALGVEAADLFPKGQAPLWSDESPTARRASIFGEFIVSVADKWISIVSEPGKDYQKLIGISEAVDAFGDAVDDHIDEAYWDSLPNEERLEIIRGMQRITEVIEHVTQTLGDEILEEKSRRNREKIREWTRRLSA